MSQVTHLKDYLGLKINLAIVIEKNKFFAITI